jgi:hypothetical protein
VNFRIIALMRLLSRYQGDEVDGATGSSPDGAQYIASILRETGSADFASTDFVLRALQRSNDAYFLNRNAEQLQIAAELVAKFMRVVPPELSRPQDINAHHLAFRFFVLPQVKAVFSSWPNGEAARVRAVTEADMRAAIARFTDAPLPSVGARAYALPDYRELRGKTLLTPDVLLRNDVSGFPYGVGSIGKTITSVHVEPKFDTLLDVELTQSGIKLQGHTSYTGNVYFDYTAQSGGIETSTRVYVSIRPL